MTQREWPRLEVVRDPEPDTDDETEPTNAELVPVAETETALEGPVLPARPDQPQIRILPGWLRTPQDFASATTSESKRVAVLVAHHGFRLPAYYWQVAKRSPVGIGRLSRWWALWVSDRRRAAMLGGMSADMHASQWNDADKRHARAWLWRLGISGAVAWLAWWGIGWAHTNLNWQGELMIAAALALVFGVLGRPVGRPLITSTGIEPAPPLTAETIIAALAALGIGELNKALRKDPDNAVRFVPPGPHRDGPGVRIDLDLPLGVTAGDVMKNRAALASGLRRDRSACWPEGDPDAHEGRLILWVADKPMSKQKPVTWPLAMKGKVDLFEPFPIGADPRGKPITLTLMGTSMLIGAQPDMGKSYLARLILLAAGLDVRAELHIYDLRGSIDLMPLESVAHRFQSGEDEDDMARLLDDLKATESEMKRRYGVMKRLGRRVFPQGKVTSEIASRRDLGMHPIVFLVDEAHVAFGHPDLKKEFERVCTNLGKRGRAAGITQILLTQRLDAGSIPTGITASAILRYCMRVADQVANDMILGTSAYKNGIRATMFARSEKGVGYLSGESGDPVITRAAYVDAELAEKIAARARAMRIADGRLTGEAAGEVFELEAESGPTMLDHIAELWPVDEKGVRDTRASYVALAAALAEAYPDKYPGCTKTQVASTLRAQQIPAVDVNRNKTNLKGVMYGDVEQAITERDEAR